MHIKISMIEGGIYILPFLLIGTNGLVCGWLFWHAIINY